MTADGGGLDSKIQTTQNTNICIALLTTSLMEDKMWLVHGLLEITVAIALPLIKTLIRITGSSPANGAHHLGLAIC